MTPEDRADLEKALGLIVGILSRNPNVEELRMEAAKILFNTVGYEGMDIFLKGWALGRDARKTS